MIRDIWYAFCTTCRPNSSRTVRYAFPLVAVAALMTSFAAVILSGDSYVSVTAHPVSVKAGETFFIDVTAFVTQPVNAVDIVLDYPADRMDVDNVDVGESVITLWTEQPYAENGKIYMRGGTFRGGFVGEHLIARVRAVARESGSALVTTNDVTFVAGDGEGTLVDVTDTDDGQTKIYITNEDGTLTGDIELQVVTDLDGDGKVTLADISRFMSAWFGRDQVFDFNGDGRMTFRDFSILLADSFFR